MVIALLISACAEPASEVSSAYARFVDDEHLSVSVRTWPAAAPGTLDIALVGVARGERAGWIADGARLGCGVSLQVREQDFRETRGGWARTFTRERVALSGRCQLPSEGQLAYLRVVYRKSGGGTPYVDFLPAPRRRGGDGRSTPDGVADALEIDERYLLVASQISVARWVHAIADDCDDGNGRACFHLGLIYESRGRAHELDAQRLFDRSCGLPGGFGCERRRDLFGGVESLHLRRGCAEKRLPACQALVDRQESHVLAFAGVCSLSGRHCDLSRWQSDATAAVPGAPSEVSRLPPGVAQEMQRMAQGCDENCAGACAQLAEPYGFGEQGFPLDVPHAIELARRACNEEATAGCTTLALLLPVVSSAEVADGMHAAADGDAPTSEERARMVAGISVETSTEINSLMQRACDVGVPLACRMLANGATRVTAECSAESGCPEALQRAVAVARLESCAAGNLEHCDMPAARP